MELFILFLVAGLAAVIWFNYRLNKNKQNTSIVEEAAPYKVEPVVEPKVEPVAAKVETAVKETKVKTNKVKATTGSKSKNVGTKKAKKATSAV